MPEKTEKLLIPMNTDPHSGNAKSKGSLGEHWHLLVFDVGNYTWEHYNSIKKGELGKQCKDDANRMAMYCMKHINLWLQAHGRVRCSNVNFENLPGVPDQGAYPDCMLYTCYWIKRSVKPTINKSQSVLKKADMIEKMQARRVGMAYKLLTASGDEESWGEFSNSEYLSNCLLGTD